MIRNCVVCGNSFKKKPSEILKGSGKFCSMKCRNITYKGSGNPKWRGGIMKAHGYIYSYAPSHPYAQHHGYVMEHRLIMEKHLKRYLLPTERIDHINGISNDNRIENLRLCKHSQNLWNTGIQKNNTSGYKGVFKVKDCNRWQASIQANKKHIFLGSFELKEEAALAYNEAAKKYHGEFARLNIVTNIPKKEPPKPRIPWNKGKTGIYSLETIEKMRTARLVFFQQKGR